LNRSTQEEEEEGIFFNIFSEMYILLHYNTQI